MRINKRFSIDSDTGEVLDHRSHESTRLEPRLVKLLCLLAENRNQVVSRQRIIKEIWDDYPGAGEGLNQAISFLRKVLQDEDKELIRTLPKSGYSLHVPETRPAAKRYGYFAAAALVLLVIALSGLQRKAGPQAARTATLAPKHDTAAQPPSSGTVRPPRHRANAALLRQDSAHQAEMMRQNADRNSDSAKKIREESSRQAREKMEQDAARQAEKQHGVQ